MADYYNFDEKTELPEGAVIKNHEHSNVHNGLELDGNF
jgi:hypothetical protein